MTHPQHDPDRRFWEQVAEIGKFFDVAVGPPRAEDGRVTTGRYVAEQGYLLVRPGRENVDLVCRHVSARRNDIEDDGSGRVVRVPIDEDVAQAMHRIREVPQILAAGPRLVTPNHFVTITPVNACPADEPTLPMSDAGSWPGAGSAPGIELLDPPFSGDERAGAGVDVLVVDTGLVDDYLSHSWMRTHVSGRPRADPPVHPPVLAGPPGRPDLPDGSLTVGPDLPVRGEPRLETPPGVINMYVGHGTFIAGVVRCVASGTRVYVSNKLRRAGALPEEQFGKQLLAALRDWPYAGEEGRWPDIISLSAGAATCDSVELLGLSEFLCELDRHPETVLVAAAGNDGERCRPFWPAALAPRYERSRAVIAVGALRQDRIGRACFSNHGDWVTVYAPGERLVNALATGTYTNAHGGTPDCRYYPGYHPLYPRCTCVTAGPKGGQVEFTGLATWSGTSFATPIVAGRIARCMTMREPRLTSREAVRYLLNTRRYTMLDDADRIALPVLLDGDGCDG
ncbi:MAG TPA: S8/S53 family peptidase [Micromonosporaceae bacterium]|nr:S8/S53 family peptidase [Micromonosporaceae bacterium]